MMKLVGGRRMTLREKVCRLIALIFGDFIYLISVIVPKRKNLWVFGAWMGETYSDNSKYLFEYVIKNYPEIQAVWLVNNETTLKLLKSKNYPVFKSYSLKGTWISMRAKVAVLSTWFSDINWFTVPNKKFALLWHGTPLKKIGFDDKKNSDITSGRRKAFFKLFPYISQDFSKILITAPSDIVRKLFVGAFKSTENIRITGFPRNDVFSQKDVENFPIKAKILELKKKYKIGIYMPTHRKNSRREFDAYIAENLDMVNSRLKEIDVVLLFKYHVFNPHTAKNRKNEYSNIIILNNEDINQDVYPLLTLVDFLVTDYSSIYFDFLLADKPIIFAPFLSEQYICNDRELYFNYNEVTPGPKAKNWDELLICIEETIKKPDEYKRQRAELNNKFNQYHDGGNCKRVFDEIIRFIT